MNDFAVGGPHGNAFGLVGGAANAVAPGKRPLSSMTPTFVEDDRGVLVFGTPGGSRIISMVLLGILDYVDSPELDLERVVGGPRFHHQYLPDRVQFEPSPYAMPPGLGGGAQAMGHTVEQGTPCAGATCRPCSSTSATPRRPPTTIRAARPGCCSEGLVSCRYNRQRDGRIRAALQAVAGTLQGRCGFRCEERNVSFDRRGFLLTGAAGLAAASASVPAHACRRCRSGPGRAARRHAGVLGSGGAARQGAADQEVLPSAQLRDPGQLLQRGVHAQRCIFRALSPGRHSGSRRGAMAAARRRRGRWTSPSS